MQIYCLCIGDIYIIENTFDPPSDITAIPQSYTVHCVIAGGQPHEFHYYYQDSSDIDLHVTSTYCSSQTGYGCSLATDNTVTTDVSPDDVIDKTITVTWRAEEISSGAFRQNNNNGDHVIGCYARRGYNTRTSTVTIEGIKHPFVSSKVYVCFLAPSSSPTDITVVNTTTTSITVNWMYDTSDADGYVVYHNGTAKLVEGGDMKETTLDGLIPGTSYSVTVRAYQDILGPPSTTLNAVTGKAQL